jgi:aerobic-type carbon monoxide dehydrogenase small subunit (CoxS/CutS family)
MPATFEFHVNGQARRIDADADRSLLSILRHDLELSGTKYGCGEGECGACTVLIDGVPTRSCITTAAEVAGKKIETIESLEQDGRLHPVQEAFLHADALQCGYCTGGMIMSCCGLLAKNARPTDDEIIEAMDGNICRCGTYQRILSAIRHAAKSMQEGRP